MKKSDTANIVRQSGDSKNELLLSITEDLRISNEQLRKDNAELKTLFDSIEEVLFSVDLVNFRIIQMSGACGKVYGHTAAEFMADLNLWSNLIYPDDRNVIRDNDEKLAAGKTVTNQYRIIHKNKSIRWIEAKIIPTLDENSLLVRIDGITKDITENKLVEVALQRSEANLRTIFNTTATGYLLIDTELNVISFNEQAGNFAARELHQVFIEGHYSIDFFLPARRPHLKKMMQQTLQGSNINYEINYLQPGGSTNWYHISMFAVPDKDENIFAVILSINDITERKLAEEKLKLLNIALEKRAAELALSNEELERFAYISSHDLQEPLRMVSSFLHLLQKKYNQQLDDEAQKYISFAVGGAARMKILITDLLEFSRISTVKKEHGLVNLNELLNQTTRNLNTSLEESHASLTIADLPEVHGDGSQLMQVFQNLISNALKYSGNITPVITVGCVEEEDNWKFSVNDNGIGISGEHFERIFIIFQRLHNRSEYSGTGIGLAICKKIVELHAGKIWVESVVGKGSSFYFTIPK